MRKNKGFTLIEMMIVILVIAVLALIVGLAVRNAGQRAKSARKAEDVRAINEASWLYQNDTSAVPANAAAMSASTGPTGFQGPYLTSTPVDPFSGGAYVLTDGQVTGPADVTTFLN